jgi:hypothetical protein
MTDTFLSDQQRSVRLRQARLARIDARLRELNEEREATSVPEVRALLAAKLDALALQREALEE